MKLPHKDGKNCYFLFLKRLVSYFLKDGSNKNEEVFVRIKNTVYIKKLDQDFSKTKEYLYKTVNVNIEIEATIKQLKNNIYFIICPLGQLKKLNWGYWMQIHSNEGCSK